MEAPYTVYSFSKTELAEKLGIAERTIALWRKQGKPLPSWAILKLTNPTNDGVLRTKSGERIHQSLLTQSEVITGFRRDGRHFDVPENEDKERYQPL